MTSTARAEHRRQLRAELSGPEPRHDIRDGICAVCGKRGLISKTTNKCVGQTFLPDKKMKSRIEACMRRVSLRDKEKQKKHNEKRAPILVVRHDYEG